MTWPRAAAALDALGQQAAWWWAVPLATSGRVALAAAAPLALVAAHLALRPGARRRVALTAAAAAAWGLATDGLLVRAGVLVFAGGGGAPAWMAALWAALGAALTLSLEACTRWSPLARAGAGALAGPLAYRAGAALGALQLAGAPALLAVSVQWAAGFPLLCALASAHRPGAVLPARP